MKKTLGVLFARPDRPHEARGAEFGAPGVFALEPVQSLLPPSRHLAGGLRPRPCGRRLPPRLMHTLPTGTVLQVPLEHTARPQSGLVTGHCVSKPH